jgi:hypothetical protein
MRQSGLRTSPLMRCHRRGCVKVFQPCDGGRLLLAIYFATVVCPTSIPRLSGSPWMRGASQSGFAILISRMSWRIWAAVLGRPPRGRDSSANRLETRAMPTDQRLGLEDFQRVQNRGGRMIEPGKDKAIQVAEDCPLWGFAPQHIELVPKGEDFSLQRGPRSEQSDHGTPG